MFLQTSATKLRMRKPGDDGLLCEHGLANLLAYWLCFSHLPPLALIVAYMPYFVDSREIRCIAISLLGSFRRQMDIYFFFHYCLDM